MRLINNHYPRVTSFSLLGAPIALAESLSAMHRANVISRTCVVFFVFFFFGRHLRATQNMQIVFARRTNHIPLVN